MEENSVVIHETALVAKGAKFGIGVKIGAYASIGSDVSLGDDVVVDPYASVDGVTTIGEQSRIGRYAYIGAPPQHRDYKGEPTKLNIGSNNNFCAYSNVSIGTMLDTGVTTIGDRNSFMISSHIAHDCIVGNDCIFANGTMLGGHVEVSDGVVFGGQVAVHQFIKIGQLTMIGGGAIVTKDVFPYTLVQGDRARTIGINKIGLTRSNFSQSDKDTIKRIYKRIFITKNTLSDAISLIESEEDDSHIKTTALNFLHSSKRGICR